MDKFDLERFKAGESAYDSNDHEISFIHHQIAEDGQGLVYTDKKNNNLWLATKDKTTRWTMKPKPVVRWFVKFKKRENEFWSHDCFSDESKASDHALFLRAKIIKTKKIILEGDE